METTKRKLGNLLIHRQLQLRIILTGALYMMVVCVITIGIVQFPPIYDMLFGSDLNARYRAAQSFLLVANQLVLAMGAVFIFFFLHQIMMTHRLCGPFINFSRTFQLIGLGDLTRKVRLRKNDYLHKESDEINKMMEGLAQVLSGVKNNAGALRLEIENLAAAQQKDGPQAIQSHMKGVEAGLRRLEGSLAGFKLPG